MEPRQMANDLTTMGRETGNALKEKAAVWGEKAKATGAEAVARAKDTYNMAHDKTLEGLRYTDQTIRQRPYEALGVAFGVGILLGWLLSRKD